MCIRLYSNARAKVYSESLQLKLLPEAQVRIDRALGSDIFPGGSLWVGALGMATEMTWGLTPAWAKNADFGRLNCYNARSETLLQKPSFKNCVAQRRCVVPVASFFEQSDGSWFEFELLNQDPMLLAGIYEPPNHHIDLPSFAIVTTVPTQQIEPVNDRMPVLLTLEEAQDWMNPDLKMDPIFSLMKPKFEGELKIHNRGSNRRPNKSLQGVFEL